MSTDVATGLHYLAEAIEKANKAAEKLVRCAESISNPVYSVSMQGHKSELKILAVRHFQGQICITVEDPQTLEAARRAAIGTMVQHGAITGKSAVLLLKDEHDDV